MSERKEIIELKAPERRGSEKFVSRVQQCCYCGGQGGFIRSGLGGDYREACPDCHGTGKVQAVVHVAWVAAGSGKEVGR